MKRITFPLLMTLLIASKSASAKDTESVATKCSVCNQLMEKIDKISSQITDQNSIGKTDNTVATQLIVLTSKMANTETLLQATIDKLQKSNADFQNTKADLLVTKSEVEALRSRESHLGSSSFVRWGRKTCPGNTSLVYSGVAGGKSFNEKGSGTNRLCLSRQPEFDNKIKPFYWGQLYGAEYEYILGHHDHDVPCSVCRAQQSSTIMVPGTRTCPPTWTPQYHGHLVADRHVNYASEYVCLDQDPENDSSGAMNQNGNLFCYTVTRCGSLPCPPYVNDKVVTCVVCSK